MLPRYDRYFLSHVLWLKDHRAEYLVQDKWLRAEDIFGVELKTFSGHEEAVKWLGGCMVHDPLTMHKLRKFLAEKAPRGYLVHRMSNPYVIDEIARTLMKYRYPIVVRPNFEDPRRATSTIDVLCAIRHGASPAEIGKSPALAATETKLKTAHAIRKATLKKDGRKHHQAQLKLLGMGERPLSRAKRLPHTGQGWQDPDVFKKVLVNNVNIIFTVSPDSFKYHAMDTVVSGRVIDEFIAWLDNEWPPPAQMEQLLAAFTLGWLYERIERPSAEAAKEIPKAPAEKRKAPSQPKEKEANDWIGVELRDDQGNPLSGFVVTIKTKNGRHHNVITGPNGRAQIYDIDPDNTEIEWQDIDEIDFLS